MASDLFTIRIFAPDGNPEGVRIIDRLNWTGLGMCHDNIRLYQIIFECKTILTTLISRHITPPQCAKYQDGIHAHRGASIMVITHVLSCVREKYIKDKTLKSHGFWDEYILTACHEKYQIISDYIRV
jgi:hypothetical protein